MHRILRWFIDNAQSLPTPVHSQVLHMVKALHKAIELSLKRLDLAADRAQGNAEFARRRGKAAVARTCIEGV